MALQLRFHRPFPWRSSLKSALAVLAVTVLMVAGSMAAAFGAAPAPSNQASKVPPPETGFRLDRFPPAPDTGKFDTALLEPLSAYAQVRSAGFGGWADTGMYIGTQLGRYPQVHQVAAPGADRRQLTFFPRRMSAFHLNPQPRNASFLFTQDEGGNEQFRLGLYDLKTGTRRAMGCPPGRVDGLVWNDSGSRFAYAHTPAGTDRWDLRIGGIDGRDTLALSLPGTWAPMDFSPDGKWLLAQRYVSASQAELHVLSLADGWLTPLSSKDKNAYADHAVWVKWPSPAGAGSGSAGPRKGASRDIPWAVAFTSDRVPADYRIDSVATAPGTPLPREGAGFHRLWLARPKAVPPNGPPPGDAAGAPEAMSPPEKWDVEWVQAAPDKNSLIYSLNEDGISRLYLLASGSKQPRLLAGIPPGVIDGVGFRPGAGSRAGSAEFAFTLNAAATPGDVYAYDIAKARAVRWTFSEAGGLPAGHFRAPQLVRYPGRGVPPPGFDSLRIPAWVYLPDPKAFPGPRPVLIQIHGGPEMQTRPGFDAFVQYAVTELGFAVAQPNVRGSSGYGRAWLKADDGYARMESVKDVGALLDWIRSPAGGVKLGMDPARMAVSGRSYGGFMALSALIEYGPAGPGGPALKAGISAVGITHFPTFLQRTSGYRRDLRRAEYGDERDPRMAAFLDSISPLTRMDRIRSPLLLLHGRNDPRVPYAESERLFAGLKTRRVPVWFLTFAEEGHAVRDQDGQIAQWKAMAEFLVRNLGPAPR
jgi:acetyl esterase/lipase